MRFETQVLSLRNSYILLNEDLFGLRGKILELHDKKDWGIIQTTLNSLSRFRRKEIFAEPFVKAYGTEKIVENIGKIYLEKYSTEDLSSDSEPQIML